MSNTPKKFYRTEKGEYSAAKVVIFNINNRIHFLCRYEALKLAYETLKNTEIEQRTIDTLEMAMWKSCILAGPANIEFDRNNNIFNKLKTELLFGLDRLQVGCSLTDETEMHSAGVLIDKLTDLGRVDVALRISTIFNYNHKVSVFFLLLEVETIQSNNERNDCAGSADIDFVSEYSRG